MPYDLSPVVQGPPVWHPAPNDVKDAARRAAEAAAEHGVDIAKLAIMEAVQQRGVATSLIGFATPEQVRLDSSSSRSLILRILGDYFDQADGHERLL